MTGPPVPVQPAGPPPAPVDPKLAFREQRKALLATVDEALRANPDRKKLADEAVEEQTQGRYRTVKQLRNAVEAQDDMTSGIARSAAQGALFDFGDELQGIGAAVIPGGRGYTEARDEFRAADDSFKDAHEVASTVAGLGGGLVSGLATLGLAAPATALRGVSGVAGLAGRVAPRIAARAEAAALKSAGKVIAEHEMPTALGTLARVARGGAIAGAAQGVGQTGSAPGQFANVSDLATQGVVGGILGGGLAGGASIVGRSAAPVARALRGKTGKHAIEQQFLDRAVKVTDMAGGTPAVEAGYLAREAVEPGAAVLADVNPMPGVKGPLYASADWAVSKAPGLLYSHMPKLVQRSLDEGKRVSKALLTKTGFTKSTVNAINEGEKMLANKARVFSGETGLYERIAAKHKNVPFPDKATPEGWFHFAAGEKALAGYQTTWLNRNPSFAELQAARGSIDAAIEEAAKKGARGASEVNHLKALKETFTGHIEKAVPQFASAQKKFGATMRKIDALAAGREAIRSGAEVEGYSVVKALKAMSPPERKIFKIGMLHEYLRRIGDDKLTYASASRIFKDQGDTAADKLRQVFKSKADLNAFMKHVDLESDFNLTKQAGLGSQTAPRQALDRAVESDLATPRAALTGGIMGGLKGLIMTPLLPLIHEGKNVAEEKIAARMGEFLLTQGKDINLAQLKKVLGHKQGKILEQAMRQQGGKLGAMAGRPAASLLDLNDDNQSFLPKVSRR